MKKITTLLAIIFMAFASQGAYIQWTLSGLDNNAAALKDYAGVQLGEDVTATIYLIFDTTDSTSVLVESLYSKTATKTQFETALAELTLTTLESAETGKKPTPATGTFNYSDLVAGTTYDFTWLYIVEDSLGNGYIRHSAEFSQQAKADTDTANSSLAYSSISSGSVHQVWAVPVPEPATAAMALAGLALLFRRKRK